MTGVRSPLRAVLDSRANRGQRMTATRPARLPRPVPAGQGHSNLKRIGPRVKTEGHKRATAARGRQLAGHFLRYPA